MFVHVNSASKTLCIFLCSTETIGFTLILISKLQLVFNLLPGSFSLSRFAHGWDAAPLPEWRSKWEHHLARPCLIQPSACGAIPKCEECSPRRLSSHPPSYWLKLLCPFWAALEKNLVGRWGLWNPNHLQMCLCVVRAGSLCNEKWEATKMILLLNILTCIDIYK